MGEEMPLHRNIDLNILLLGVLLTDVDSHFSTTNLREEIIDKENVESILIYYKNNEKFLKPRLLELRNKLNDFLK